MTSRTFRDLPAANGNALSRARAFACTDSGNAERIVATHGRDIRFCGEWRAWLKYDGARWERDATGHVHHLAKLIARGTYREASECEDPTRRAELGTWAKKSESRDRRAAMVTLAQSEPAISIHHAMLDRDAFLFNVANGTIDLRSGTLRPHRREDYITKISPTDFDAKAEAPRWERFLAEVLPDADVRTFLQRFAGYCLTGDVSERMFLFTCGGGRNGKSVFTKVLRSVLGEYATVGAPDLLMAKSQESHPTEIADLFGARLVTCQELPKGRTLNEQRVKELTGDEGSIKARRMGEDFWSFRPEFKFIITGNHPPRVTDDTDSIWDRMCKVPFDVRISDDAVDKKLFEKLQAELPGILAWAVRGCLDWQKYGLRPPRAVAAATNAYRHSEDTVGRFFVDCCAFHPEAWVASADVAIIYAQWCRANGEREVSRKALAERLAREGCTERRTKHARGWRGVRLLYADEERGRDDAGDEVTRGDVTSGVGSRETGKVSTDPVSTSPSVTRHQGNAYADDDGEPFYVDGNGLTEIGGRP